MKVLVTGASGFVGRHVCALLSERGHEVIGVDRNEYDLTLEWPELGGFDGIVHLAGLAATGPSFEDPQLYIESSSAMATRLFEAQPRARVLVVSSGVIYAPGFGLDEDAPLAFSSPYVVAKVLVENQVRYYRARGIDAVVARPFNHIGPGQRQGFIVPDLAAKLALRQAQGPTDEPLPTGNLSSARDYTDVRDVARAYLGLLEAPRLEHVVYNVCSGNARTGHEVLAAICAAMGQEVPPVALAETRSIDPSVITGSAARLQYATGWLPRIPFQQSIQDFVAGA